MELPKDEKGLRALDATLKALENEVTQVVDKIVDMDPTQVPHSDNHQYHFVVCGLRQAQSGLRSHRETIASTLGRKLLGLPV